MRGTYTHYNPDFTNDLFHMADLGFTELSMEPVVCAPGDPCALTEEDFPSSASSMSCFQRTCSAAGARAGPSPSTTI